MIKAYELLSEEQKKSIEKEYRQIQIWYEEQKKALESELREAGKWEESGLDANQHFFAHLIQERKEKVKKLRNKYGFD